MAGPSPSLDALPDPRTRRLLRAARALVMLEVAWPALAWAASLAAAFAALALFDVLPRLPVWLHLLVLATCLLPLPWLAVFLRRARAVDWRQAARRVEAENALPHHPFQTLWDRPAGGDCALWADHVARAASRVAGARLWWPRSDMARRDPWGLRAGALLVLAAALAGGTQDWRGRLSRAVVPVVEWPGLGPDSLEVWVTPPAYTGLPPHLLRMDDQGTPVPVPAGSAVLAVLSGGLGTASLVLDGRDIAFSRQDGGSQRAETQVQGGEFLAVRQAWRQVAGWPLKRVADLSPDVDFASAPEAAERGRLLLAVVAGDDYGLTRLWVEFRRLGAPVGEEPLRVTLPLPASRPKQFGSSSWHDLTAHPWAGLPVLAQPVAEDDLGQRGAGEVASLTLPERNFLNPFARKVIEQRRLLTESRTNAPGAMGVLDQLSVDPSRFNDDLRTFLALRATRHALSNSEFDLAEVQDLLWNAALRMEDGDLASAEQRLEDVRRQLEQALDENVSGPALDALLDQFQAALQRYMAALAERLGTSADQLPQAGAAISDQELLDMVGAMRDMAAVGARDGLRRMLRDMAGILDDLQTRMPQKPSSAISEAMRGLRDLTSRQQRLLEQSHRQSQEPAAPPAATAKHQQQELRQALQALRQQLMQGLGQEPVALGDADQAMDQAIGSLGQGDWGAAATAQGQALDFLTQGMRQALEDMASGAMMGAAGLPRDPLGRAQPGGRGFDDDGSTRVPEQVEMQRARAILDELRRRAGEFNRSRDERDYLLRLLRQF
ncbi:DUF4175 family protein [Magnetospirillum sp. 64-120]|uniref:DUF4175 domain-containing protein n=1 Tax=Magnetospirillum sp. 64-120 TaxID=1895778 RepID=UPI00092A7BD3|nr:DUF4175 family protein [Magnetospirillum sp. 64-120]OJX81852.1 MAG: hypothetical protein BGO92_16140 [Magnetospirillum sp. 64-120]